VPNGAMVSVLLLVQACLDAGASGQGCAGVVDRWD